MDILITLLSDPNVWIAFFMLAALEIVLGIDNVIFITVLVSKLPPEMQNKVRNFGLSFAMITRIGLLFSLSWIIGLTEPLFSVMDKTVTGRDLVLFFGGLFLLYKSSKEIYSEVENKHASHSVKEISGSSKSVIFWSAIVQIGILDIVFSLDSVITAVGMVEQISVMVAAVIVSVAVMMIAARPIGEFVQRHPSVKVLALSFLTMVGTLLIAESFGVHVPKGYIYGAMAFSLMVELLNIRAKSKKAS